MKELLEKNRRLLGDETVCFGYAVYCLQMAEEHCEGEELTDTVWEFVQLLDATLSSTAHLLEELILELPESDLALEICRHKENMQ